MRTHPHVIRQLRRAPLPFATPARNLTHKDLWKFFGSKGITFEVFHGKRSIGETQAKKLAAFFHVLADLFI